MSVSVVMDTMTYRELEELLEELMGVSGTSRIYWRVSALVRRVSILEGLFRNAYPTGHVGTAQDLLMFDPVTVVLSSRSDPVTIGRLEAFASALMGYIESSKRLKQRGGGIQSLKRKRGEGGLL